MLHFFRKHQKYFFLFTTIIIVSSFVFFGSYQAFSPSTFGPKSPDETVFHAVDGKPVRRSYLDNMVRFLEREDWMHSAKIFDANYLNDGVISRDFLEGGLYEHLLAHFSDHYRDELTERQEKERGYIPYQHPYMPSISAMSVWSLFAPEIADKLVNLRKSEDPIASFHDRVDLFLSERSFPPAFLTQMLRYQERENGGKVPPDPRLSRDVISLFGYIDFKDWFGESFVQSVAQIVINTAAIARQKGYSVSEEEALAELQFKSQKSYDAIKSVGVPVENGEEFFAYYLRYKGLDEATAIRIWEEIALFRRMMQEVGSAALVDALPLEQFYAFANENATIELYQMAPEYRFNTDEDKQIFEAYLDAIAPNRTSEIPLEFAAIETIKERAPELVGKHYRIYVGSVDKEALQAKVTVKQTWDWEVANWEALEKKFLELAQKEGSPFERLEQAQNRKKIDAFARSQIVAEHPEWVDEGVRQADMKEMYLFLNLKGDKEPIAGITDNTAFQNVLDEQNEIVGYTQDEKHFYRILVDERSVDYEVLSFKKAKEQGLLTPSSKTPTVSFANYLEKYREDPQAPWEIEKREVRITRAAPTFVSLDEVLAFQGEGFSPVKEAEGEGAYCYKLKEVYVDTSVPMQKWLEAQELLAKEMKAQFFENILSQQLCSKNLSL